MGCLHILSHLKNKIRRMRPIDLRIVAETFFLVKRENEMTQKVHK